MAGPTCTILLPDPLRADHLALVDELIGRVSDTRQGEDFWVVDTRPIGGSFRGDGRSFIISSEPAQDREESENSQIREGFGWLPVSQVSLAAMCNSPEDHQILAEIALSITERLGGVIDLNGNLPIERTLAVVAVTYRTISETTAEYLVVQPEVLRKWRENPAFHMVK